MATEKGKAAFSFLLSYVKAHKAATYATCWEAAQKRGHQVWPIMFGRAKALLGQVKSAKRGTGKFARAKTPKAKSAARSEPKSVIEFVRKLEADRARMAELLVKVREIVGAALTGS